MRNTRSQRSTVLPRVNRRNITVIIITVLVFIIIYNLSFKYAGTIYLVGLADHVEDLKLTDSSPDEELGIISILFYTLYLNTSVTHACDKCLVSSDYFRITGYSDEIKSNKKKSLEVKRNFMIELFKKHHIIVFHAKDVPKPKLLKDIAAYKPRFQVWAYYNKESPYNSPNIVTGKYDHLFQMTITPLQKSDVFAPYGTYRRKHSTNWLSVPSNEDIIFSKSNKDDLKTRLLNQQRLMSVNISFKEKLTAAWIASNCNEIRDQYVLLLRKHIPVHIYGFCGKVYDGAENSRECQKDTYECEEILRKYKFILAFENSFCNDYVTEKYWNAIIRGNVPIVLGGSSYGKALIIPGSAINVRDYKNIEDLVTHIKFLNNNEEEYNRYFDWRKSYEVDYMPNNQHRIDNIIPKLNEVYRGRTYQIKPYNLSYFYDIKQNCPLQINDTFWEEFSTESNN